jgi:hypothetical protein
MEDIIGVIILYGVMALACAVPLYVIVRSIINYMRAVDGRGRIVIKALVVLCIWAVLSFTLLTLAMMSAFEGGTLPDGRQAERPVTIMAIVFTFIYVVVGLALAYWVRLQPGWKTLRKSQSGI